MRHGPSTVFSYAPKKRPIYRGKRVRALPTVFVCEGCGWFLVGLYSPRSKRRVCVSASSYFKEMALVYSYKRHGPTHFCSGYRKKAPREAITG